MNVNQIKTFLENDINLNQGRYNLVNRKFTSIKELLEKKMINNFIISKQGSMATKTAIKPKNPEHEYDLDIAIHSKEINNSSDFVNYKNRLLKILNDEYGHNVVKRKNKCINIFFTKEFNCDVVVMKNKNGHQSIYDEFKGEEIKSDNLNLGENINEAFKNSKQDSLRDTSKLIKFYLRQHSETDGLLPSIVQSLLIISQYASSNHGYKGQMLTTISSIIKYFCAIHNLGKCLKLIKNPSNGTSINTNINFLEDMKNVILVLQDLRDDIEIHNLRKLKIGSDIRSTSIDSRSYYKWWMKK